MAIYGLSRDVVENLRTKLETRKRTELLRPKSVQVTREPVPATFTQYRRETQDPYRAKPQATTSTERDSEDEGFGWGAVIVSLRHVSLRIRSADRQLGCCDRIRRRRRIQVIPLLALMAAVYVVRR